MFGVDLWTFGLFLINQHGTQEEQDFIETIHQLGPTKVVIQVDTMLKSIIIRDQNHKMIKYSSYL